MDDVNIDVLLVSMSRLTMPTRHQQRMRRLCTGTHLAAINIAGQTPEHLLEENEDGMSYQEEVSVSGRFGQFNVVTPITKRTFNYTSSTLFSGTHACGMVISPP